MLKLNINLNQSLVVVSVAVCIFGSAVQGQTRDKPKPYDLVDDGFTEAERFEAYGSDQEELFPEATTVRDVIIYDSTRPNVYFGMYRASQMTAPGWDLFTRSLDWCNGMGNHATTKVWLATYNGTLDGSYSAEKDGIAVYDYMTTVLGFLPANIHVAHQSSIETASFAGYDIVVYAWSYPRDATNVMNQQIPFLTFSAGETDEMGIGTGVSTMHESRDFAYVVRNNHYITSPYALGMFTLVDPMWIDASTASGNGVRLVAADQRVLVIDTDDPCPGVMSIDAVNAKPNHNIFYIYGFTAGVGPVVPGCPGLHVGILAPKIAGSAVSDVNGYSSISGMVPAGACGKVVVQAVDQAGCEVSNVLPL